MLENEKKIIGYLEEKKDILFFLIISLLGIYIRYQGRDAMSGDMVNCLIPWYDRIKQGGKIAMLGQQVGNYNILYQTIIVLFTYINIKSVYMYKILSIIFDYAIAYAIAYFLCKIQNKKKYRAYFNVIYAIVLFLPTVVLNSAYWGQCDSIYSFFVVLTLLYVYQEKYTRAFIYYGIAFGFKLQAIFILPFLICIYIKNKKFSIYQFGITLLVFWATGIAGFIYGRGFLEPFQIYMKQSDTYKGMYLNCASFYRLLGGNYTMLKGFAMSFIVFLFGIALYVILVGKKRMVTGEQFLNTVTWFVWTCLFFLPAMHERYTYLLDLLLIMLVAINRSYLKYAFLSFTISLMTYGSYLYGNVKITHTSSFLLFAAWIYYTVEIIKKDEEQKEIEVVE